MTHPQSYVAIRTTSPICIDGKLDDPAWQTAPWTNDFVDIEGDAQPKPTYRTHAKMLWDDEFLYVGMELEEPHVWGTLTEHDSVMFEDNDVEVFIDPDGDCHEYYEFEMNALGTYWDLLLTKPYKDGGSPVNNWEAKGIQCAAWVDGTLNDSSDTDKGWSAEIAFPWSALKECAHRPSPPNDGDQWRINFSRVEWDITIENGRYQKVPGRPEHNWIWSPQGAINMHRPETWGIVQFSNTMVPFKADPTIDARLMVAQVYYAQKDFLAAHGRYAQEIGELKLDLPVKVYATPSLFEAICDGVHMDSQGRVWMD